MKTRSAKNKGKKLQNWVRDRIVYFFGTLRGLIQDGDVKSTTMGENGEDIQLSPLARKYFDYHVECKSLKAIAVYKYYEQATSHLTKLNIETSGEPLVFIKMNGKKPLALVDAEHFIEMVAKVNSKEQV